MKLTCISAANVEGARNHSASVRACELVRELALADYPDVHVEIVPLLDYELNACRMCGRCFKSERCARDEAFNQVFEKMIASDGVFMVVPHYAPLPSKLMMLFEKMQEIAYLHWCANNDYRFPLTGKPVGVIAHGGQQPTADVLAYYQRMLVEPVAMALSSVSMQVIGAGKDAPRGITFGIQSLTQRPDSIFVDITHDWQTVRTRIAPLVKNVLVALQPSAGGSVN